MPVDPVDIIGLAALQEANALASRELKTEMQGVLKGLAEPVRATAQGLAISEIRNMTLEWSRMRTGVTVGSVYVAPVKRGVKRQGRSRPNLFNLLLGRALEPALNRNVSTIVAGVEAWIDTVLHDWSKA